MKEDAHLIMFFDWLKWQEKIDPRLQAVFHVENERKTTLRQGAWRKRKGVRAGIADVINPIAVAPYNGLFMELKIKPNKLTKDQVKMMELFHTLGWCCRVAWNGDEAIEIFKGYMKGI
jgi:hypothetical protein